MRTNLNPYNPVYLLISSQLSLERLIPLLLDAIDNEILIQAKDDSHLFHSTQSCLQYLFSLEKISKDLFQKISQLKSANSELETSHFYNSSIAVWACLLPTWSSSWD